MNQAEVEELVLLYQRAWREPDDQIRSELLERCFTSDGSLVSTMVRGAVVGRAALAQHMGDALRAFEGYRVVLDTGIQLQLDRFRFHWRLLGPASTVVSSGIDIGELSADGRIHRITVFAGAPSPLPVSWPAWLSSEC